MKARGEGSGGIMETGRKEKSVTGGGNGWRKPRGRGRRGERPRTSDPSGREREE